ncbi:ABC transporter-like protein, partial [Macrophomina phaseolina MS6]
MRFPCARPLSPATLRHYATKTKPRPPLISINNATFYRNHPDSHDPQHDSPNPPLYPNLSFTLPTDASPGQHWAILSPNSANRTTFLQILRGQYLSVPPTARSYPYLQTSEIAEKDPRLRNPSNAIQYVGFDAERGGLSGASTKGAYMSARYESLREVTDWSVRDYLMGNTELNADENLAVKPPEAMVERVMRDLNLTDLQKMPVSHLSNGQTRRARIAKALLARPELLLLDGPFMGLDPHTLQYLSGLLHQMAEAQQPRLLLSLRPQDVIPQWITHFIVVGNEPKPSIIGDRREVFDFLRNHYEKMNKTGFEFRTPYAKLAKKQLPLLQAENLSKENVLDVLDKAHVDDMIALYDISRKMEAKGDFDALAEDPEKIHTMREKLKRPHRIYEVNYTKDGVPMTNKEPIPVGDPVVQMEGVQIKYGDSENAVLGNWEGGLWWEVRKGQRWGVFGPNGSGKTTLLSLITSDHPQTYSAPVKLFGRSRLPTPGSPGLSVFDIQQRMGHSSPEVHTYFPKHLTVRRVLESAWADTPLTKPKLSYEADQKVDACLRWFRNELNPELGETLDQRGEAFCCARDSKANERIPIYLEITETTLRDEEALLQNPSTEWAETLRFRDLTFSAQRVALFLRAIIKSPDLIVLDEAFSGMDELARDKCLLFLNQGERMMLRHVYRERPHLRPQGARPVDSNIAAINRVRVPGLSADQALVVVAHTRDEVPGCVREYITLPESGTGQPPRVGRLDGPISVDWRRWGDIWDAPSRKGRLKFDLSTERGRKWDAVMGKSSPVEVY